MNKNYILTLIGIPVLILIVLLFANDKNFESKKENNMENLTENTNKVNPPTERLDPTKTYTAILKTTQGNITISLNNLNNPITTTNFVHLSRLDFYNGTVFHRVMRGFMVQGGDPLGTGTGGPGYQFADEEFVDEYERGAVAMANSGPDTNGSQFFIIHEDQLNLPRNYVIFGKVIEGIEVVDKIADSEVKSSPTGEPSVPVEPTTITSIEILEEDL